MKNSTRKITYILALFFFAVPNLLFSQIIYVSPKATGMNNGTSWTDAFTDLQPALLSASAGNEIWVVGGVTYYATTGTSRFASFVLKSNVAIYGGFTGGETSLSQRNLTSTPTTVLSGDIGAKGVDGDNSYHVITASGVDNTAILDGFLIQLGKANGAAIEDQIGGGLILDGFAANTVISPTIRNCTFRLNFATQGGGVAAYSGDGGEMNASFENCTFVSNANFSGATNTGGAMSIQEVGTTSGNSTVTVKNCLFNDNSSVLGGALSTSRVGTFESISVNVVNSVFDGNGAPTGGAVYCVSDMPVAFTNCTFYGNNANTGPAISGQNPTGVIIENSIIWGTQIPPYIEAQTGNDPTDISNSIIKDWLLGGPTVLNVDPLFVDAASGDFNLRACSPAIDMGDNSAIAGITEDIEGTPRIFDNENDIVDFGAYENQAEAPENFSYSTAGATYVLTGYCKVGSWVHYFDPNDPGNFMFSIEHTPTGAGANTAVFEALPVITITNDPMNQANFTDGIFKAEDLTPNTEEALFAMGRYWNVNITNGALNGWVNVRFFYEPSEYAAIENAANTWGVNNNAFKTAMYWVKTEGQDYDPSTDLRPTGVVSAAPLNHTPGSFSNGIKYVQFNEVGGFSGGTAVIRVSVSNPVLPVEIASFDVERIDDKRVHLEWLLESEKGVDYYEIERKLENDEDFRGTGIVDGLGDTDVFRTYRYEDLNDNSGWSYYRLKIVSYEGGVEYSPARAVRGVEQVGSIKLYPNPVNDFVQIDVPSGYSRNEEVVVTVMNTLQQVVYQGDYQLESDEGNKITINGLSGLTPGMYLINVLIDGKSYTERLLKTDY